MHLVDEFGGLLVLAGRSPAALEGHSVALTYGRAYRLTRALLDPGPGRLQVRGRFNRLVDGLSVADRDSLHDLLVNADPTVFMIVDPRPLIRTTAAIQNTAGRHIQHLRTFMSTEHATWGAVFEQDNA